MSSQSVLVEREGAVGIVTLNRPERMNALTDELMSELPERLRELAHDSKVRCVMFTGAGDRAFSAGGDVGELATRGPAAGGGADKEPLESRVERLQRAQQASWLLHEMGKPTLAAINGAVAGASLSMALACDLRIAAEHAVFVTAFAKIGFSGDFGGSWFLTQIVGTAKARELYFLAERIDAAEALRLGLVSRVVAREKFRAEALALARQLAEGPPLAYRYMKRNLNLALALDLKHALDLEAEAMVRTGDTEDFREAARAFLDKKTPNFRGR